MKRNPKKRRRAKASTKPIAAKQEAATQASSRFVKDLLVRQEALVPTKEGKLPQQATHAIVKKHPDGTVEVKRARFKTF